MVKVAILGHRGMLGSVVARYFAEQGAEVCSTFLRYTGSDEVPEWAARHEIVVNCVRSADNDPVVNGFLPIHIAEFRMGESFWERRPLVIQPSTDAICEDTAYARVKRMSERVEGAVIRAGIVDINRQPARAFTNWYCNPITPLEWAEAAWTTRSRGIHEVGGQAVDRWTLACLVARIWDRPMPEPVEAEASNVRLVKETNGRPLAMRLERYRRWLEG